jgi:hypothetical protein
VKKTIASPSDSKMFSLKFLSVMLRSSLEAGTPIGSKSLRNGVVFVTSCPATDDATGGDDFGRNLGIPSNLKASLVDTRNSRATRKCRAATDGYIFFYASDWKIYNCLSTMLWNVKLQLSVKHSICYPSTWNY